MGQRGKRESSENAARLEKHFVYLASCANGTLYVGYTTHVERRLAAHNAGYGGRYTRANRPVSLVAAWPFNSRSEALQAERALKRLPPEQKMRMAESVTSLGGADA
jgi:putative endonuclease